METELHGSLDGCVFIRMAIATEGIEGTAICNCF